MTQIWSTNHIPDDGKPSVYKRRPFEQGLYNAESNKGQFTSEVNSVWPFIGAIQNLINSIDCLLFCFCFLSAPKHLYNWLCPLVSRSVGWLLTHPFNDQQTTPYWPTWPCFYFFENNSFELYHLHWDRNCLPWLLAKWPERYGVLLEGKFNLQWWQTTSASDKTSKCFRRFFLVRALQKW